MMLLLPSSNLLGVVDQVDASVQTTSYQKAVSTDPPYYDNIGYADLSDFFYVWLRRSFRSVFPNLLATISVPKAEELVATPYRHGSKEKAEQFFLAGMTRAMHNLAGSDRIRPRPSLSTTPSSSPTLKPIRVQHLPGGKPSLKR